MGRRGWRGFSASVALAGAVGCTPPTTTQTTAGPSKVNVEPAKTDPKPPPVQTDPTPTPPPSGDVLDGRTVIASADGPWSSRRVGAPVSGSDGPSGYSSGGDDTADGGSGMRHKGEEGRMGRPAGAPPAPMAEDAEVAEAILAEPGSASGAKKAASGGGGIGSGAMRPEMKPVDQPLKAGSTDDNADYKGYLQFLSTWTVRGDVRGDFQPLDVRDRAFVRVVDGDKRPVPGATVTITDPATKAVVWKGTTYGDGRVPYYPWLFGAAAQQAARLTVTAAIGAETATADWDGKSDLTVAGAAPQASAPMAMDVVFLIDTTGSMGDELERIKTSLLAVTGKVKEKQAGLSLRYGAVAYKDLSDEYVTMAHPFTDDAAAFNTALQKLSAGGGGDLPESLNQGLNRAVEGMQWRPEAAKVMFLVADAPPQMRIKGDILYGDSAVRAVGLGIRVHSVAASGLDPLGTLVLRQLAQLTRGKFIFIEYGGTQATAASHGVTGPVQGGNNLDEILLAQLVAEIDGWGR